MYKHLDASWWFCCLAPRASASVNACELFCTHSICWRKPAKPTRLPQQLVETMFLTSASFFFFNFGPLKGFKFLAMLLASLPRSLSSLRIMTMSRGLRSHWQVSCANSISAQNGWITKNRAYKSFFDFLHEDNPPGGHRQTPRTWIVHRTKYLACL